MTRSHLGMYRFCIHCGHRFWARNGNAVYCSRAHQMAAWRMRSMLAGTHGWVGGQFARLPVEVA